MMRRPSARQLDTLAAVLAVLSLVLAALAALVGWPSSARSEDAVQLATVQGAPSLLVVPPQLRAATGADLERIEARTAALERLQADQIAEIRHRLDLMTAAGGVLIAALITLGASGRLRVSVGPVAVEAVPPKGADGG